MSTRRTILLMLAGAAMACGSDRLFAQDNTADWPQFRGPGGQGISRAKGLPTTWSNTTNVVWKAPLPGGGASSPIIVGDKIFLTCYTGYNEPGQARGSMEQLKLHLLCLKRQDGTVIWKADIDPKLPEQPTIRHGHGYASNTPVADAEHVYAFFGKSGVCAFDHAGKQLWRADVGSRLSDWGSAASPILYENLLIVNASVESESLVALDRKTGNEVWRVKGLREAWNTPILVPTPNGKPELVVGMPGKVLGYNPATGEQLWTCANDITWYIVPSIVAHEDQIWSLGGRSGTVAIAAKTGGRGDVTKTHRLWTSKKGSNVGSPIVHGGHLYWMNDNLGIAYCADAKTGAIVYEERIDRPDLVYACPILADGKIYYVTVSGRTYVVAASPTYSLLATNSLGNREAFNASPAVAGSHLLLRSDRFLYCLGEK